MINFQRTKIFSRRPSPVLRQTPWGDKNIPVDTPLLAAGQFIFLKIMFYYLVLHKNRPSLQIQRQKKRDVPLSLARCAMLALGRPPKSEKEQ